MDPTVGALSIALLGALLIAARRIINAGTDWLEIHIRAAAERSRRRNLKRARRDSSQPEIALPSGESAAPDHVDEETTDMHELVELERAEIERQRSSRRRGGTRAPRRGTHHDGEEQ